ncbi:unnamed protein product [Rotaria sordida]|uniref:Uncharacterized protein n=1 Tax=Rotaria sordida TaxID=392033 RepID=A0A813SGT1_9BILA|nr:unnamed protein product [Rotaria sordida]
MLIAENIDSTISTTLNIHATVTNAVSNAIYGVTSWIGDLIPALGKRDLENDARVNLLTELKSFKLAFQQSILETLQSFLNGNVATQLQQSISKLICKRDLENDARVNLLTELKSFKLAFQQSILETLQSFLNGNVATQFQQSISKLSTFLKTHLQTMKNMITNLIPTMQNTIATQAVTSVLNVIQVIEEAIRKIHALFFS